MKNKVIVFVCVGLLLAVLLIPWPRSYRQTLTATKLDAQGKTLGTSELTLRVRKGVSLLLGSSIRSVEVSCFDDAFSPEKLKPSDVSYDRIAGIYSTTIGVTDLRTEGDLFEVGESGSYAFCSYRLSIAYTPALDRWHIVFTSEQEPPVHYLASAVGDSCDQLISFFEPEFE